MPKLKEICPHCGGIGEYQKGWKWKRVQQKKGGTHGDVEETEKAVQIYLYKCINCKRNFRKAKTIKQGS